MCGSGLCKIDSLGVLETKITLPASCDPWAGWVGRSRNRGRLASVPKSTCSKRGSPLPSFFALISNSQRNKSHGYPGLSRVEGKKNCRSIVFKRLQKWRASLVFIRKNFILKNSIVVYATYKIRRNRKEWREIAEMLVPGLIYAGKQSQHIGTGQKKSQSSVIFRRRKNVVRSSVQRIRAEWPTKQVMRGFEKVHFIWLYQGMNPLRKFVWNDAN